ncbi:MAG TPA: type 1 glutamine amidotransferase [Tepidisphaeraceae bacterium]|nr:type 1 glutamine amidotransferase [Tepidisphaeraceae bacterium]
MSKAVILQHVAGEGPGRIVNVFRDFGIKLDIRHLYRGDEVPTDLDEVRTLIVLGGPMGVADIGNAKYPFLAKEVDLLKRAVQIDRAVLGICLGAQLLAHAAGAKVHPNTKPGETPEAPPIPVPEIGWGPVNFPFPGGTEPIVMGMHDGMNVFHWHFDTFELPKLPTPSGAPPPPAPQPPTGNALLSSNRLCKNQAFRFKNRLFGFQWHPELTPSDIDAILSAGREDVTKVLGPDGETKIRQDTEKYYRDYARLGDKLLKNFVQFLKIY